MKAASELLDTAAVIFCNLITAVRASVVHGVDGAVLLTNYDNALVSDAKYRVVTGFVISVRRILLGACSNTVSKIPLPGINTTC